MSKQNFILTELIKLSRQEKTEMFLVGGFLRDLLLKKDTIDYDLVVKTKAEETARRFASQIKGPFVLLDEENKIYRVVKKIEKREKLAINVDFSQMRGKSIEDDLALRDFTIDAMAAKIDARCRMSDISKGVIDPFGGTKDLNKKIIRVIDKKAFIDDPLRLLRAFRLAAALNFKVERTTKNLIKKYNHLIKKPAEERIHDELIKILSVNNCTAYILEIDKVKLLSRIIPEIEPVKRAFRYYYHKRGLWGHSLDTLRSLEEITNNLSRLFPKVKDKLNAYLDEFISGEIKRSTILKIAALFHDFGKPPTLRKKGGKVHFYGHEKEGINLVKKVMLHLRFSNNEIKTAEKVIRFHMRPGTLSQPPHVTDKAIWRFFRDTEEEGIGVLLVSLADYYAYRKKDESHRDIENHKKGIRKILYRYFIHTEIIRPKLLLNGTDIMNNFSLSQGPLIGKLLRQLEEAQAERKVKDKKQALTFIKDILDCL